MKPGYFNDISGALLERYSKFYFEYGSIFDIDRTVGLMHLSQTYLLFEILFEDNESAA